MKLTAIGWEDMDWINLAQDRNVMGSCEHDIEGEISGSHGEYEDGCVLGCCTV
jgi:hypothetical protein